MAKAALNPHGDYPPYAFLEQVAQHCHKAVLTYLWLWKNRDKNNKVTVDSRHIPYQTGQGTAQFNHNLLLLEREHLVNTDREDSVVEVEMVSWDDVNE